MSTQDQRALVWNIICLGVILAFGVLLTLSHHSVGKLKGQIWATERLCPAPAPFTPAQPLRRSFKGGGMMSEWIQFDEMRPRPFTTLEVAAYGGRAQLAYYSRKSSPLLSLPLQEKITEKMDVWRLHIPASAPTQSDLNGRGYVPEPQSEEPRFMLVARDPIMPFMVEAWAYLRQGPHMMAHARNCLGHVMSQSRKMEPQQSGDLQIISAFRIAQEARDWQIEKALSDE